MSDGMLEAAQAAQGAALEAREIAARLLELTEADVDWEPILLTAANGYAAVSHSKIDLPTRSVGIYNPDNVTVYLGLGGATPNLGAGAPSLPGGSLLVLPVRVGALELGIDAGDQAALAGADVGVYVMRYALAQPAFFGTVK